MNHSGLGVGGGGGILTLVVRPLRKPCVSSLTETLETLFSIDVIPFWNMVKFSFGKLKVIEIVTLLI